MVWARDCTYKKASSVVTGQLLLTMAAKSKERVGLALCGFGRAGRIHFSGVRQNRHCELKYVVDLIEVTVTVGDSKQKIGDIIRSTLAEYRMEQTKVVDTSKLHEVSR